MMRVQEITSREAENRRLTKRICDFLHAHALDPTPANYTLAHKLVTDEASPVARAIVAATADGLRLSQAEADRIRAEAGMAEQDDLDYGAASDADMLADARRSVDAFAAVVAAAQAEASSYQEDLADGAARLDAYAAGDPAVAAIVQVTGAMLERTRAAETQLDAARREAQSLREKLAEAEREARRDPLTRLPNRRAFEDRMAEIIRRQGPASIAICDIDQFKSINDTHGHGVGDRVLRMVADALQTGCTGHLVARLGGEEFVILFEGLGPGEAAALIDTTREELATRQFKVRGTDAPLGNITFSAGVASCAAPPDREPPLKRADILLYEAKNSGRNRVLAETG
jgi:diguanylate cyclase